MVDDGKWWLMMVDNGEKYGMITINEGFQLVMGVPPVIIHFRLGFSRTKTIHVWGTPMTLETPK